MSDLKDRKTSPSKDGADSDASNPAMNMLIPTINKLQEVFNVLGASAKIDLPQIVVVGSQSAGKSSVLESICHRDFLPRGSGIVTRRPLVLQLHTIPEAKVGPKEYGVFGHCKDKKFDDFNEIRKEIEAETERLAGDGQCVSENPIFLRLYSPYVLNLTLVDLPGLARNPVGDQPKNIEFLIKEMIMKFISKENALILAVSAANTDLATSDALSLAASVDPNGDRTIGVLTKIDLMDRGTDALKILTNREAPLKLGWTGVVNRSQADIDGKVSMEKAQQAEMEFFLTNPKYRDIAHAQGTQSLAKKLNTILIRHIKKTLPSLRERIRQLMDQTSAELAGYGTFVSDEMKPGLILSMINKFAADFDDIVEGRQLDAAMGGKSPIGGDDGALGAPVIQSNTLYGGARIAYIFNEKFSKMLDSIDPSSTVTLEDIRTMVRNAAGPRMLMFIPMRVLELLAQRVIRDIDRPCHQCLKLVLNELISFTRIAASENPDMRRFRTFHGKLLAQSEALLEQFAEPCHRYIRDTINCEVAFINPNHPDFKNVIMKVMNDSTTQQAHMPGAMGPVPGQAPGSMTASQAMNMNMNGQQQLQPQIGNKNPFLAMGALSPSGMQSVDESSIAAGVLPDDIRVNGEWNDNERNICELIPRMLNRYYNIIRKKIQDTIPKCIMYFVVNRAQEQLQQELVARLYSGDYRKMSELLDEDPDIARRRESCLQLIGMLQKAEETLKQVDSI